MEFESMERRAEELARQVYKCGGSNPIVFFDSGAILDFEEECKRWRLRDSKISTMSFYDLLFKRHRNLFMNGDILEEVSNHYDNHFINGRKEVSRETYERASLMFTSYLDFMFDAELPDDFDYENVRYDVYWAGQLGFDQMHKKCCQDKISPSDKQLIVDALTTRYLINKSAKDITGTIIVSPDCHHSKTIDVLIGRHPETNGMFGYLPVSVISTRRV